MKEKLIAGYWKARFGLQKVAEDFMKRENGASDMVTVIILIVIVIAVAGIFQKQLTQAVTDVFDKLGKFIRES